MLNIVFSDAATEPATVKGLDNSTSIHTDRVRITVGTTEFTLSGSAGGFTITKVDHRDPLNEPVTMNPIHTNKVKIT